LGDLLGSSRKATSALVLVVIVIIAAIYLRAGTLSPTSPSSTTSVTNGVPIQAAKEVLATNTIVTSEGDAQNVLSTFHEAMFQGTLSLLRSREDLGGNEGYLANVLATKTWLYDHAKIERRVWKSDQYWVLPASNELFVVVIPLVAPNVTWTLQQDRVMTLTASCKDPSEAGTTDQNGNIHCVSGVMEISKQVGWIKFLIDGEGVVYYGGTNPE
jgi:hypothetical protein